MGERRPSLDGVHADPSTDPRRPLDAAALRGALVEAPGAPYSALDVVDEIGSTNAELLEDQFPGVEVRGDVGEHTTLLSIDKARVLLGYEPEFSWRNQV